jgi:hypothetical protein
MRQHIVAANDGDWATIPTIFSLGSDGLRHITLLIFLPTNCCSEDCPLPWHGHPRSDDAGRPHSADPISSVAV